MRVRQSMATLADYAEDVLAASPGAPPEAVVAARAFLDAERAWVARTAQLSEKARYLRQRMFKTRNTIARRQAGRRHAPQVFPPAAEFFDGVVDGW